LAVDDRQGAALGRQLRELKQHERAVVSDGARATHRQEPGQRERGAGQPAERQVARDALALRQRLHQRRLTDDTVELQVPPHHAAGAAQHLRPLAGRRLLHHDPGRTRTEDGDGAAREKDVGGTTTMTTLAAHAHDLFRTPPRARGRGQTGVWGRVCHAPRAHEGPCLAAHDGAARNGAGRDGAGRATPRLPTTTTTR